MNTRKQIPLIAFKSRQRLQRLWWTAVIYCFCVLSGGVLIFSDDRQNLHGLQGIFLTTVITVYALVLLRIGMELNYQPRQKVLHSNLGYGTWITITPAMLIALLAGYLFQPWPPSRFVKMVAAYIFMMPLLGGLKDRLLVSGYRNLN